MRDVWKALCLECVGMKKQVCSARDRMAKMEVDERGLHLGSQNTSDLTQFCSLECCIHVGELRLTHMNHSSSF